MARATLTIDYDESVVSARYMAQHLTETVEGVEGVEYDEED